MGPKQVLPLQVRVDLEVMAMKEYSLDLQNWGFTIRCSLASYSGHNYFTGWGMLTQFTLNQYFLMMLGINPEILTIPVLDYSKILYSLAFFERFMIYMQVL